MNQKIPFHELAKRLSAVNSISDESAEVFIKNFFDLLGELIVDGETVRIKGLGSFATVGAGNERVVEFIPDKDISDTLNAPFASFEPVELNVDVTAEMLSEFDSEERPQVEGMQLPKVESPEVERLSEETVINTNKPESDQNESEPALQVEPVQEIEFDQEPDAETSVPEIHEEEEKIQAEIEVNSCIAETNVEEQVMETEPAPKVAFVEEQSMEEERPAVPEPPIYSKSTIVEEEHSAKAPEPKMPSKAAILEEEPEEYVEHVTSDGESGNGNFGWGFLVGLLVGLALGACAVYLAIDYLFPYGRTVEPSEIENTEVIAAEIPDEPVVPTDSITETEAKESTQPVEEVNKQKSTPEVAPVAANPAPVERRDTVRRGYLIHDMSKKYYGSKDFWVYIYEENKSKIGNPNKMQPGDVLVIPSPEKYGINASSSESLKKARSKAGEILSKYK